MDCSNLSYNSRPSETVLRFQDLWLFLKYQTWKPGVLQYLKAWHTTQSCWRLEEAAAAAGSCATGLWQDRVLPGWWQQVYLSYLAVTFLSDQESLATSLLSKLDGKTTSEAELTEAFCRDVDSFSFEFERQVGSWWWWFSLMLKLLMMILVNLTLKIQESPPRAVVSSRPQSPRISSNKPPLCAEVFNTFWKIQTCWKFWYYKPPLCAEV